MSRSKPQAAPTWTDPAYIAWAEKQAKKVLIRYADVERAVVARLVYVWEHDGPEVRRGPIMSASSGPKDYLVNQILSLFTADPDITAVSMLVLNGMPFLIIQRGNNYRDVTGREVRITLED